MPKIAGTNAWGGRLLCVVTMDSLNTDVPTMIELL